jgi:hypothetical protein
MNLTNEEIRTLREILRRFRTTNGLNKLISSDNTVSITSNGCHVTDLKVSGGGVGIESLTAGD